MRFIPLKGKMPSMATPKMHEAFKKLDEYWESQQRDEDLTYIKLLAIAKDGSFGLVLINFTKTRSCFIDRVVVEKVGLEKLIVRRLQKIFPSIKIQIRKDEKGIFKDIGFKFSNEEVLIDKIPYIHGDWKRD